MTVEFKKSDSTIVRIRHPEHKLLKMVAGYHHADMMTTVGKLVRAEWERVKKEMDAQEEGAECKK